MNPNEITRRQLFIAATGVGLAPFVSSVAAQQRAQVPSFSVNPRDFGLHHRNMLDSMSRVLERRPLDSKEGLFRIVDLLVDLGLVTKADGEMLRRLIAVIFDSTAIDAMSEKISTIYKEFAEKAGEVAVAITSIARDSVEYVKKLDARRAIYIVSSDVSGALMGAAAVAKVGPPILALIGALAGAVATSGSAAFGSQRQ